MVNIGNGIEFSMDGYKKDLLDNFIHAVKKGNTSVVLIYDGRSGMGKTTMSIQDAMYMYNDLSLENIYYTPEDFLNGLANAKEGSAHIFDEAMLISNRSSMSVVNKMMIQAMSMIRSKNIFVIFNINSIFDLDKNIALSRADVLFHVYGDNLLDRGNFAAFFKAKGQEDRLKSLYILGKKYYSYSKPKANFYGRFSKEFLLNKEEYEKRKQEGVNSFLNSGSAPTGKHNLIEAKLMKYIKDELGLNADKIADIAGVSRKTVFNKMNLLKWEVGEEKEKIKSILPTD